MEKNRVLSHSTSLFDAQGTEALALRKNWQWQNPHQKSQMELPNLYFTKDLIHYTEERWRQPGCSG